MGRIYSDRKDALESAEKYLNKWDKYSKRFIAFWTEKDCELIIRPIVTSKGIDSWWIAKRSKEEIFAFGNRLGIEILSVT
ncbi:MAG: hypothetical protein QMD21_07330, partial [Candidatus Thermoplasmatota archaeon]|nr:hypothetical protein [Candidatus Thermoplasmatota archaeon]